MNGNDCLSELTKYRAYDPAMGRWWQVDPLADYGDLADLTPYNYSFNNPVRYNDPEGDCGLCLIALPLIAEGVVAVAESATVAAGVTALAALWKASVESGASASPYSNPVDMIMSGAQSGDISGLVLNSSDKNKPVEKGTYGHLKEPKTVGPGLETTPAQRKRILEENKRQNGDQLTSDGDGRPLNPPKNWPKVKKQIRIKRKLITKMLGRQADPIATGIKELFLRKKMEKKAISHSILNKDEEYEEISR